MSKPFSTTLSILAAVTCTFACAPRPKNATQPHSLDLAELVRFQQHQVSTDLISLTEDLGLDGIGYGWWRESDPESGDQWLRLGTEVGQLNIFSSDGDLAEVDIELNGGGKGDPRAKIRVRLNGERLARVPAPEDWTSLKIDIPPHLARRGVNHLEFSQPGSHQKGSVEDRSQMLLRRVRIRSDSGRRLWLERPQNIAVQHPNGMGEGRKSSIEMPVSSFFEAVFPVPDAAHLRGTYRFDPDPKHGKEPVYLYVELLDSSNRERTLFHSRFYKRVRRPQDLSIDLSAWAGEKIRLRIGTTGTGNGVFRWSGLGISAADPVILEPQLPPIDRRMTPRTGMLGKPDVLVILLDAARADAFTPWGGPHPTPKVERLANDATVFADAISPAPWTGQSVPSIMTGLFPDSLGVGPWGSHVPETVPTLAEMMNQAGYRTVLWSQHPVYGNHNSFRRGFEEYYRTPRGAYDSVPGAEVLIADDRPSFTFVHLIPPHAPYTPPAPFRGARSSWYRGNMQVDPGRLNTYPRRRDPDKLTEEDRRYVFDRYLENAAFADALVGRILAPLTRTGRYDDTLVILLSDHGEAFMEHQHFLHTKLVNREMLHVPFLIKWPQAAGLASSVFEEPVSLVDVVPTLVDGLALDDGGNGFQGVSLLSEGAGGRSDGLARYAVTRGGHGGERPPRTKLMLEVDGWRLLCSPDRKLLSLYLPETDPLEMVDLSSERLLQGLYLKQAALAQWHSNRYLLNSDRPVTEEVGELDPDVVEELEALGYLD